MEFWDRTKKNLPIKKEKGEVEIVEDKNYEIDTGEYREPPWAISSRITKTRINALTGVVQAESNFYNAVGERDKSLARLGSILENEIIAEKAEAEIRAMKAVEEAESLFKHKKNRDELTELKLKVEKAKLQQELDEAIKPPKGRIEEERIKAEEKVQIEEIKAEEEIKIEEIQKKKATKKLIAEMKEEAEKKAIIKDQIKEERQRLKEQYLKENDVEDITDLSATKLTQFAEECEALESKLYDYFDGL